MPKFRMMTFAVLTSCTPLNSLNDSIKNTVSFELTFSNSITDLQIRSQNNWYDPSSNMVFINFAISSRTGVIPRPHETIATIPSAYKPSSQRDGFAHLAQSNNYQTNHAESMYITTNGDIKLGNWIYTSTTVYIMLLSIAYRI